jgi:hypothetical protein
LALPPLIPDSGPLFSLASAGQLAILDAFPLIVTDVVWMETGGRASNPHASAEALAIDGYLKAHSNWVPMQTQVGAMAAAQGLAPNLGELSIQEVCVNLAGTPSPLWVLFEDQWFQVKRAHFPANVALLGTHAFLLAAEKLKLIPSAAAVLKLIQAAGRMISTPTKPLGRGAHASKRRKK